MFSRTAPFRVSIVTFFLFFAFGATGPVMSLYLQERLHFTGTQTGLVMSMSAVSALVSPVACSFVADRVLPAERLLALLLLAGGSLMGVLYRTQSFGPFLILYLLYYLAVGATFGLSNAIIFHHVGDRNQYGRVRVWGTLGWIAVAWVFGWLWLRGSGARPMEGRLADALLLCSVTLVGLGLYCLTLPCALPRSPREAPEFVPREAFRVLRRRAAIWLAVVTLAATVTDRIYIYAAAIFLRQSGVSEANVLPMLSLGQIPEIFGMLVLGRLTTKLGLVPVMVLGALSNVARYAFFLFGGGLVAASAGVLMHGLSYAFFFSTVAILLDGMTRSESRAGVHQLFGLVSAGIGGFLGSWIAGVVMDACRMPDGAVRFGVLWSVPFGIAVAVTVALLPALRRGAPSEAALAPFRPGALPAVSSAPPGPDS